SRKIREKFLHYFKDHGHEIVKSASLVPQDDPTLLFINAGMAPFKNLFLGLEKRSYTRATSSQKCVRAGGKHNDLNEVGYTNRHHTFFEMLGNFSFGDYFKEGAIDMAWELLTAGYGIPEKKLWVSVYTDDDEAYKIWNENIGVPHEKILRLGGEDNFWSMGNTGPCGPCSEIYIDQGAEVGCGKPTCKPGCGCDRYLEIWNLVFTQYNREPDGALTPLPRPNIDTGMGLERLAAVLQGVYSNYDSDLFVDIVQLTEELAELRYGQDSKRDISFKVIADHSRTAAFLIADGIMPSNEGRGYVLRRIIRRAIRYGQVLGLKGPFLHRLTDKVVDLMNPDYPELGQSKRFIEEVVINEEQRFADTLFHGLSLLKEEMDQLRSKESHIIPGSLIFRLYDTFGFPPDLVEDIARDDDFSIDLEGFDKSMAEQRATSQRSWKGSGQEVIPEVYRMLDSRGLDCRFLGYETLRAEGKVISILKDGDLVDSACEGERVEIILDQSPFYSESGGQVGDTGWMRNDTLSIKIVDTIKYPANLIIHKGEIIEGVISVGNTVEEMVDEKRRKNIAQNHTATHLLQAALREILGEHVKQAGSHVGPERMRFDFTHFAQIPTERLQEIEMLVNLNIQKNLPVTTKIMPRDEAFKQNAIALFEERYGDNVRVITIGDGLSRELCGGTHVTATGDIGVFLLASEGAVASGIRRIEAFTGESAIQEIQKEMNNLKTISGLLKTVPDNIVTRVEHFIWEQKEKDREIELLKSKLLRKQSEDLINTARKINGVNVISQEVATNDPKDLREFGDHLKDKLKSGIIVLGARGNGKVFLLCRITPDLTNKFNAGEIIKNLSIFVGGKGGGRSDMAQGGGTKISALKNALSKAFDMVSERSAC
ncbi:MAG: alanine--tRNA ligase, partial [Deltaproteobacteria bacterium]|nr:alanine--tRNA ligase [Deltaproteobacteria bacterium]